MFDYVTGVGRHLKVSIIAWLRWVIFSNQITHFANFSLVLKGKTEKI